MPDIRYKRILLKVSGEVLGGYGSGQFDFEFMRDFLTQVKEVSQLGVGIGIVVGGGNILRGSEAQGKGLGRVAADYIGMLGTVINGIALRDVASGLGFDLRVMTCLAGSGIAEPYVVEEALEHIGQGYPVVFVGGTGNPFLTTDTAAALRAAEIKADVLLKATKVDGVYTSDPMVDSNAKRFERITYREAAQLELNFMDRSALWICQRMGIPIVVFNVHEENGLKRIVLGERIGTIVEGVSND